MDRTTAEQQSVLAWERFFGELSSFIRSANRQFGLANINFAEFVVDRLEVFIVSVSTLSYLFQANISSDVGASFYSLLDELLQCLRDMQREWQDYMDHYQWRSPSSYSPPLVHTAGRGRPRFNITLEQLQYLRSMSFTWLQIAEIVGVSYMTIYRRKWEYGIVEVPGGNTSDIELHEVLRQMRNDFPTLGQTLVWGRLRSVGINVSCARVREAIRVTDPIHSALRWSEMTSRRPYTVPGPNSLWHLTMVTTS